MREEGSATRQVTERTLHGAGIGFRPGMVFDHPEAIKQAVMAGLGVACAVGSSTPRLNITGVLGLLGLEGAFCAIVSAEDVTRGKPDPQQSAVSNQQSAVSNRQSGFWANRERPAGQALLLVRFWRVLIADC